MLFMARDIIINLVREQNKGSVIRVKQENYNIIDDINGLVACEDPDEVIHDVTPKSNDEYSHYTYNLI